MPVSEIENLLALPAISRAIAEHEGHRGEEVENRLTELASRIFALLRDQAAIDRAVVHHCKSRIDRKLKLIDLGDAKSPAQLKKLFTQRTSDIDVGALANDFENHLNGAVQNQDLERLLVIYSNKKGILKEVASVLRSNRIEMFSEWLARVLRQNHAPALTSALKAALPEITPT